MSKRYKKQQPNKAWPLLNYKLTRLFMGCLLFADSACICTALGIKKTDLQTGTCPSSRRPTNHTTQDYLAPDISIDPEGILWWTNNFITDRRLVLRENKEKRRVKSRQFEFVAQEIWHFLPKHCMSYFPLTKSHMIFELLRTRALVNDCKFFFSS